VNRRFGGTHRLHRQGRKILARGFSTLTMEAIPSSETSVHTRSTQRHIPEDGVLHAHRRENFKSYREIFCFKALSKKTINKTLIINPYLFIYIYLHIVIYEDGF
jgi:hypothetical protein